MMKNLKASLQLYPPHKPNACYARLYRMGLVDIHGNPELLGLEVLASVTSGCLYDDLGRGPAMKLYTDTLGNLIGNCLARVYEDLSHAYSDAGEPVPKAIVLLAKENRCLLYFIIAFFENWREYLMNDKMLEV